jgi:aspartate/methionine/tyrosine aminotransferase
MKLKEFEVETWMTEHENDCRYNLADTCVKAMSLRELEDLVKEPIMETIYDLPLDYGPIQGSPALKKAILSLYKTGTPENIAIARGAVNANQHVMDTLLEPGDHIVALTPGYEQFYTYPKSLGCDYALVKLKEENNWQPTIEDFKQAINDKTKMIILNSPNNPTGTLIKEDLMRALIDLCAQKHIYILCDEIYKGLTETTVPSISDLYEYGITTSSLAKIYSFAGLRLGWIKARKDLIDQINFRRDYTMISTGAIDDYLTTVVLNHKEAILKRSRELVLKNKAILKDYLTKEPLVSCVIPEDGTVAFLHYHVDVPSKVLCEGLQKQTGVFFVPGACFGLEYHLRFGFTQDPDIIEKGLQLLSDYLRNTSF